MRLEELDYDLPRELIAQFPAEQRSASRLLIVDRKGGVWHDRAFRELPDRLTPGDVLVLNNTSVVPAKFFLRRKSGGRIEGLWLRCNDDGTWQVLLRGAGRLKVGEALVFEAAPDRYQVQLVGAGQRGDCMLMVSPRAEPLQILNEVGTVPLPHYIRRDSTRAEQTDAARYQTVYARMPGAVAAPTAGLHFDDVILARLARTGIQVVEVTLHVGLGTFQPIGADDLADHVMHSEAYEITPHAWEVIRGAGAAGRRIVAVGTTSARVLESVAAHGDLAGLTSLFIYPPRQFEVVDVLITNFHLPRSTLLAMIYAFGGASLMKRAYAHAIEQGYRFYSYGDAMLIE